MASIFERFDDRAAIMRFKGKGSDKKDSSFAIDVTTSIDTNLSANVTNFPVEGRGNITDHIQPAPIVLSLKCMISESPSNQLLSLASGLAGAGLKQLSTNKITDRFAGALGAAAVTGIAGLIGKKQQAYTGKAYNSVDFGPLLTNRKTADPDFPKRAMVGLLKMFQQGTIFDLHTFFTSDIYTDMVMTSLSFSQTPEVGESLAFNISCKQIAVTEAFVDQSSREALASNPAGGSLSAVADKGKASAASTAASDKVQAQSSVLDAFDFLTGGGK